MEILTIEIKKNKCFTDGIYWGKVSSNMDLGQFLLNVLFYLNKTGEKQIQIRVNDVDETQSFKDEVRKKYSSINNTELRDRFFLYSNIK